MVCIMKLFGLHITAQRGRPARWLLRGGVTLLATMVACIGLEAQQRKWIFQAGASRVDQIGASRDLDLQDRWIEFDSAETQAPARLHALWLPQPRADAPVLLYLHGARCNLANSGARMQHLHDLGFSVLGVDYRGFGQSTPALPSERMACEDARAAWAWLAAQHPQAARYVYGHSLGGAIAVQLVAEVSDAAGLIVEGTFTSLSALYRTLSFGRGRLTPQVTQRFEAAQRVAQLRVPLMVVHGSDDELVHPDLGRALFEQAAEPKRFVLVAGGSHHDTHVVGRDECAQAVRELFGIEPASA